MRKAAALADIVRRRAEKDSKRGRVDDDSSEDVKAEDVDSDSDDISSGPTPMVRDEPSDVSSGTTKSPATREYLDFYAIAMAAFKTNPKIDPVAFDESDPSAPKKLDDLIGLAEERALLQRALLGTITVPDLAVKTNTRPSNVLLYGPGGTGKSVAIRAIAHQANYALFAPTSSQIIGEYLGEAARNFRAAYYSAKLLALAIESGVTTEYKGVIFFLDEADAFFVESKDSDTRIASEFKQLVQSNLATPRMVIAAATNFPEKINDSAILSRFPVKIFIGPPTPNECVLTALDAVRKIYNSWPTECREGQRKTFEDIEAMLTRDSETFKTVRTRLTGHTPREIVQLVSLATGPESELGLVGSYFAPVKKPNTDIVERWQATDSSTVGASDARTVDQLLREGKINVPVCGRLPDARKFLDMVVNSKAKRAFTIDDMKRFYKYATTTLVDENGATRLDKLIKDETRRQTERAALSQRT